jgi:hypothetical protein
MKKSVLYIVAIFLSALLITGASNAQNLLLTSVIKSENILDTFARENNFAKSATSALPLEAVNSKVLKDFNRNYKDAKNVKWFNAGKGTIACFKEKDIQTRVVYYPNGRRLHTLMTYGESELSDNLKSRIKEKYAKYSVTCVTEVHEGDKVFYFINIETSKDFKQLIAYLDEIWVHKQFQKQ